MGISQDSKSSDLRKVFNYGHFPEFFVDEFETVEKAMEFVKEMEIAQYCKVYKVVCGEALEIN